MKEQDFLIYAINDDYWSPTNLSIIPLWSQLIHYSFILSETFVKFKQIRINFDKAGETLSAITVRQ